MAISQTSATHTPVQIEGGSNHPLEVLRTPSLHHLGQKMHHQVPARCMP